MVTTSLHAWPALQSLGITAAIAAVMALALAFAAADGSPSEPLYYFNGSGHFSTVSSYVGDVDAESAREGVANVVPRQTAPVPATDPALAEQEYFFTGAGSFNRVDEYTGDIAP